METTAMETTAMDTTAMVDTTTAPDRMRPLHGQRALVTGATNGIGRATALRLAEAGAAEVLVHGRDPGRGKLVVDAIQALGGQAEFLTAEIGDEAAVRSFASAAGDVDILVNNAGLSRWGATGEFDLMDHDDLFAANVASAFILVSALAPGMAARGHGSIINVSSMAAHVGVTGGASYGATKAALEAMTRAWAAEFSPAGVRINAVAPGPVLTGTPTPREFLEQLGAATAMGRVADPHEIAEAIAFLASPQASYITGAVLAVDGGRTAI